MREECKSCRKWEEDIYWSHFQVVQFFQAIPQKFANNLREKLAGSVSLKGPSGATWNVGLTANGDALFLKNGWKEFVDAHILEENDLLIFKYNGDSRFDVLMFDRQNFCEKEASYFVRRCVHTDVASGGKTKRPITENEDGDSQFYVLMRDGQIFCEEEAPYLVANCADTDVASGGKTKRPITENEDGDSQFDVSMRDGQSFCEEEAPYFIKNSAHTDVVSGVRTKRSVTESESSHEVVFERTARKKPRNDGACTQTSGARANGKLQIREIKRIRSCGEWKSNRRPVTLEEKQKAFGMATAALTENSVMVVMRPSHVYKVFYMPIPTQWARIHLPQRSLDVMLRVKEKTWSANFYHRGFSGRYKGYNGGLSGGWKNFVLENFLEESDVCVFNLIRGEDTTPILDVSIFRVVEEIIPPSRVTPPSSKRGRPRKATTKPPSSKRGRPRKAMTKKSNVDEDGSFQVHDDVISLD